MTPAMYRLGAERAERAMADALIDWLRDPNRKPAHLQFSASPERELADEIELAIQREKDR